jgi:hypothetical protein
MMSVQLKCAFVCLLLLCSVAAWSDTKILSQIEDRQGWDSCVKCAGGKSNNASIATSPFVTDPSVEGDSRNFYINGAAYSNALWWYKLGSHNSAKNFKYDFWLNVSNNTQFAQTLEFDAFQFVGGRIYMFGTQCNYAAKVWDVWNADANHWWHTTVPCTKFTPHTWYHVTMTFHRTTDDNYMHYDDLVIVKTDSQRRAVSTNTYHFSKAMPSGKTGWQDNTGVQFQIDIGKDGMEMQEWVDKVSLTSW